MKPATLTPPNRSALWSRLALTKAQLAELCGVTTRQVSHWTLKGYLGTSSHHPDRYSGEAIDLCVLIKQGLDQGLPLRRAVGQARAFLSAVLDGTREVREAGGTPREAYRSTHEALAPRYGSFPIFEHTMPFNVQRAWDELDGIDHPRIWTAKRDIEMWKALQG